MSKEAAAEELRFPGYDVLAKRYTPSWDEQTRQVINKRLAVSREPAFFSQVEWETINAVCDRILPQSSDRPAVPLAAYLDEKLHKGKISGYRFASLPPQGEAWQRALKGLDEAAEAQHGVRFHTLNNAARDALLTKMQKGELEGGAWGDMSAKFFFEKHVLPDIVSSFYAHPSAWSEIGFGGPASPCGYVRLKADRRDPWEATEAKPGEEEKAMKANRRVG